MKKLIELIKAKERENNISTSEKKASPKAKKAQPSTNPENDRVEENDLFWDGYSDIGYC